MRTALCDFTDAVRPFGYSLTAGGKKVSVMTDLGHVTEKILKQAEASFVLLESNHDVEMLKCGPYPYYLKRRILSTHGHLSNDDAAQTACRLVQSGVRGYCWDIFLKKIIFMNSHMKRYAAFCSKTELRIGKHVAVGMAKREGVTGLYSAL